ncbi:MAG TPA: zf-TFIIB domain-containing protein [Gemmatimonadales bacterium]|nr:zf-TFIIB domain-containing protein [Gemmatimonadales bacterium]
MSDPTTRYACPVCLGVKLGKLQPSPDLQLVLDYCQRCGGVWFDQAEVALLRRCHPLALAVHVELKPEAYRMRCHGCGASLGRNAPRCDACGWRNVLSCPTCGKALKPVERDGARLDVCRACQGVWFDNVELATIWNARTALTRRPPGVASVGVYRTDHFLLDAVLWGPDVMLHTAVTAAGDTLAAANIGLGGAGLAEVAGGVIEGTGALAGGVFDAIAGLIGGLDFF